MPLMNGLEETRILTELMPAVPVIVYSVHDSPMVDNDAGEAVSAGLTAWVSTPGKPFDIGHIQQ